MSRRFNKKYVVAAVGVVAALAISAAAIAFFTDSGTGTGNASVGTSSSYLVTTDALTGGPLYPGSGTENVAYHVKNESSGQQQVSSITAVLTTDVAGGVYDTTTTAFVDGCKASWFTLTNHPGTLPDNLAGGATHSGSVDVILTDSGTNQDPCKNLTPQVTVHAS
jgi:hypothetical protein